MIYQWPTEGTEKVLPATEAWAARLARNIQMDFRAAFRNRTAPEIAEWRGAVERFCRKLVICEQPPEVYFAPQPKKEYPTPSTPDGDRYAWRVHTMHAEVTGGYIWKAAPETGEYIRVLRVRWYFEDSCVYYGFAGGRLVSGTLMDVWDAQNAAGA